MPRNDATAIFETELAPDLKSTARSEAEGYLADFVGGVYVGDAFAAGTTIETFCSREFIEKHRPGWLRDEASLGDLIEAAAGGGPKRPVNLKDRSALLAKVGEEKFAAILREYGATVTRNGTRPDNSAAAKGEVSKNPWHASFKGDRVAAQIAVIKGLGTASAARMAKSAGVTLSGQPLRD